VVGRMVGVLEGLVDGIWVDGLKEGMRLGSGEGICVGVKEGKDVLGL